MPLNGSPKWCCPLVALIPSVGTMTCASRRLFLRHVLSSGPLTNAKTGPFLSRWKSEAPKAASTSITRVRVWRDCPRLPPWALPAGRSTGVLVLLELHAHHVEELIRVCTQVVHQVQEVLHCLLHDDCALREDTEIHEFLFRFDVKSCEGQGKTTERRQSFTTWAFLEGCDPHDKYRLQTTKYVSYTVPVSQTPEKVRSVEGHRTGIYRLVSKASWHPQAMAMAFKPLDYLLQGSTLRLGTYEMRHRENVFRDLF